MSGYYLLQMEIGKDLWINMSKPIANEHAAVITRDEYRERMKWTVNFRLIRLGA